MYKEVAVEDGFVIRHNNPNMSVDNLIVEEELVVAVPTSVIQDTLDKIGNGVLRDISPILGALEYHRCMVPRGIADNTEEFRQIIPYVVVRSGGEVFTMKRKTTQGEKDLHEKLSVGVGGHMNEFSDKFVYNSPLVLLLENATRELNEEVNLPELEKGAVSVEGLLNDSSNSVGRRHIGVLFTVDIPEDSKHLVTIAETDKMEGFWSKGVENGNYETWSSIALEHIKGGE